MWLQIPARLYSIRIQSDCDSTYTPQLPPPLDGGSYVQRRHMDAKGGAGVADHHDDGIQIGIFSGVGWLSRRVAASALHDGWRRLRGPTGPASHDPDVANRPDAGGAGAGSADLHEAHPHRAGARALVHRRLCAGVWRARVRVAPTHARG